MKVHIKRYQKTVVGICLPLYYSEEHFENEFEIDSMSEMPYIRLGYESTEEKYVFMCATKAIIEINNYIKNGELYINFSRKEEMYAY